MVDVVNVVVHDIHAVALEEAVEVVVEDDGKREPSLVLSDHATKGEAACFSIHHQPLRTLLRLISAAIRFDFALVVV